MNSQSNDFIYIPEWLRVTKVPGGIDILLGNGTVVIAIVALIVFILFFILGFRLTRRNRAKRGDVAAE